MPNNPIQPYNTVEGQLVVAAGKAGAAAGKAQARIEQLEKELENARTQPTDASTLKVVDYDRKIHSGLPKGTILGVLES